MYHRSDWILISSILSIISYDVLPDVLSDNKAVVAELCLGGLGHAVVQHTAQQVSRL